MNEAELNGNGFDWDEIKRRLGDLRRRWYGSAEAVSYERWLELEVLKLEEEISPSPSPSPLRGEGSGV